ncbi:phosphonate C-P lyase system protein PhnH [Pseudomonas sp. GX19020]|uniref:phosphonate C-P lyase system protein PhnH n=1 Tax=Pseudomonas sp. GX19020 TaxID=2942277 RepID=UPI0020183FB2|nr:phosphonate C-P lyase system protein PhnH [Pseudomonas sp. GX19020]MCL4066374.1 phosphonate C-P lyase system protein PhnH [Pseudomonas sp. GX19020]
MNAPVQPAPVTPSLAGGFAHPAHDAARAFRAAMQALARPGRIQMITGALPPAPLSVAAGTLALVLMDQTTPVWLAPSHDSAGLRAWLTFHTGAPFTTAEAAHFVIGSWEALAQVSRFATGTPDYPDRAATLIVEMPALEARGARLTGPGIQDSARLTLPEIAAFQANNALYPLGFDTFLTAGDQIAGLPRSTRLEDI